MAHRRAARLEWATLVFTVTSVTFTYFVLGSSQAMQTAWVEDMLSSIPPLAFLVGQRVARRQPNEHFPYGYHRASAVGHLVAATALTVVGAYLVFDGATVLLAQEHPPIGTVVLLGHPLWQGWLMIAAMAYSGFVPALLGRAKLELAPVLHDKVLHTDAEMNKADWLTATAAILGILGIGVGLWWADAVAALAISGSVLMDGWKSLRGAVHDLMDAQVTTVDNAEPLPLLDRIEETVTAASGVGDFSIRVRDMGHLFHVELRVVPEPARDLAVDDIEALRRRVAALDEQIEDVLIVPVRRIPHRVDT